MRLAYANVWNKLNKNQVQRCARSARRYADVIGFSEIKTDADVDGLKAGLGSGFALENLSSNNPIAFNTDKYRLTPARRLPAGFTNKGVFVFHPGDRDIPTPERTCSWCILDHVKQPKVPPVAVICSHFINKAWNNKEKSEKDEKQRQDYWLESHEELSWRINTFRRYGLTVIWMLDANKLFRRTPQFTPREERVSVHGIDQMYVAKGRVKKYAADYVIGAEREINTPSDHHMIVGKVTFKNG